MMPMAARSFTLPPGFRYSSLAKTRRGAGANDPFELENRGFADQFSNIVGDARGGCFEALAAHLETTKAAAERQCDFRVVIVREYNRRGHQAKSKNAEKASDFAAAAEPTLSSRRRVAGFVRHNSRCGFARLICCILWREHPPGWLGTRRRF